MNPMRKVHAEASRLDHQNVARAVFEQLSRCATGLHVHKTKPALHAYHDELCLHGFAGIKDGLRGAPVGASNRSGEGMGAAQQPSKVCARIPASVVLA